MIYFFGDVHLRESTEDINWEYNNLHLIPFFEKIPFNKKEDSIIFLGDFFNSTKHRGNINSIALEVINYLRGVVSNIYILTGNHETSLYSGNNLDIFSGINRVFVIKTECPVDIDGTSVLFLPHVEGRSLEFYVERVKQLKITKSDLIVPHYFLKENTIMDNPYLDIDQMGIDYKHCIAGHNHKFEKISKKKTCLGSMWHTSKKHKDDILHYATWDDGITFHKIPDNIFSKFVEIEWGKETDPILDKDFKLITVKCKKEEVPTIEKDIYKKYTSNVYEIIWDIIEEDKKEIYEAKNEEELVSLYFKENSVSKDEMDVFQRYNV